MEKEAAEYGDQVGMNRTALGTIKLLYNEDDLRQAGGKLSNEKVTKVNLELLVFRYTTVNILLEGNTYFAQCNRITATYFLLEGLTEYIFYRTC